MTNIRARLVYFGAMCIILVAGLSTRVWADNLHHFIALHFGDGLWAGMIYCGFRVIGLAKRLECALLLSIMFCFIIEFSQLYQAAWINEMRDTTLGGLILGHGFLIIDLIRYSVGVVTIYILDYFLNQRAKLQGKKSPLQQSKQQRAKLKGKKSPLQ